MATPLDRPPGSKAKLFVGNLSETVRSEDVEILFKKFGNVVECTVFKTYGFVVSDILLAICFLSVLARFFHLLPHLLQKSLRTTNRGHSLKYQIHSHCGVRNRSLTTRALPF